MVELKKTGVEVMLKNNVVESINLNQYRRKLYVTEYTIKNQNPHPKHFKAPFL